MQPSSVNSSVLVGEKVMLDFSGKLLFILWDLSDFAVISCISLCCSVFSMTMTMTKGQFGVKRNTLMFVLYDFFWCIMKNASPWSSDESVWPARHSTNPNNNNSNNNNISFLRLHIQVKHAHCALQIPENRTNIERVINTNSNTITVKLNHFEINR